MYVPSSKHTHYRRKTVYVQVSITALFLQSVPFNTLHLIAPKVPVKFLAIKLHTQLRTIYYNDHKFWS